MDTEEPLAGSFFMFELEGIVMGTVDCKLTDCAYYCDHCIARNIRIAGCGQVECYEPVSRSAVVHEPVSNPGYEKNGGRWKRRITGVLK